MNKYKLSRLAIEDLNGIWIYTLKKWSKNQANRYYKEIIDEIQFVSENPMSGKSAESTRKNYRIAMAKSHLIFYKLSKNKTIEVVRILHQSMDIKRHL